MTSSPEAPRPRRLRLLLAGFAGMVGGLAVLAGGLVGNQTGATPFRPTVAAELPVTAMDHAVRPANNSPMVLADPGDEGFVVMANRLDAPDFSCALHVSGDGGRRWAPIQPVPKLPEGAEKCYAPEVAFDRNGVLHYLFVGLAGNGNEPMGAFLTTSDDRGRTFSEPQRVLGPLNFAVRMAIDPDPGEAGRIHLVWIQATSDPPLGGFGPPPNPIMSAFSDDGGRTFSKPVQVNDDSRERVVAPALALGADGLVHVAYYDLGDDAVDYQGLEGPVWEETWSLVLATSIDSGARFAEASVIEDEVVPPERVLLIFTMAPPSLAVRDARVCAAWTDGRRGDPDAFARCSGDGGAEWDEARRLNDDEAGNGLTQSMPRLAFSRGGRLDAIFNDRRRHPANVLNYVFFTSSTDGGRTWSPNVQITRHASSSLVGQRYTNPSARGRVEFGSRLGLLSREGDAVAAWADTRNSQPDSTSQDVFTAIVGGLPEPSETGVPWTRIAGVALLAVGAVLVVVGLRRRASSPDEPQLGQSAGEA